MIRKEKLLIVSHREIARDIFELTFQGDLAAEIKRPGQFVHVKVSDAAVPLLRRPVSIARADAAAGTITLIYRRGGEGTALLAARKQGERVDVIGPLGNGFPADDSLKGRKVLLAGGGIGVPPLYGLSLKLKALGAEPVHVLGFDTKSSVFYEKEFEAIGETFVSTVDGSTGTKGFVTDIIDLFRLNFDTLYACGPVQMLKALEMRFPEKEVYLSLEERMGCGIGACFACVCHVPGDPDGYRKVCSDGPVFKAGEVVLSC
ncbi:dihydroorotate dehydrogenase electron transfer subunit [Bacillus mangrovi]|uniref:Dihydroorotate dehydrogenase B (NAD(+)), electron transfer subunit n=1 Tax=Metabacillus mangrovi TaxID=1491830 RepID=A0A7X2V426_9BACI|nr:dihydroorotate dehydrogenase electron transfer subunit [Metabacillus mangrovi]MTH52666.1 dihydroorotate dehydrogenase electron transfer subunit [Metabacillus mangrovi]